MKEIKINTSLREQMIDITGRVREAVQGLGVRKGLCTIYVPHTTAGITINENADPTVAQDMLHVLRTLIPQQGPYRHREGNSDAHIKASILGSSVLVGIEGGDLVLGTWQGIFFAEFDGPRSRRIQIFIISSP